MTDHTDRADLSDSTEETAETLPRDDADATEPNQSSPDSSFESQPASDAAAPPGAQAEAAENDGSETVEETEVQAGPVTSDGDYILSPEPAPEDRLSDVVGLDEPVQTIEQTVLRSVGDPTIGTFRTQSVLLYGPRGVGKRDLARAIAGECGTDGFRVEFVRTLHRHHMAPSDAMETLIEEARESAPMVLVLDCFDELHGLGAAHEFAMALDEIRRAGEQVVVVGVMHEDRVGHDPMQAYFEAFDLRLELTAPDRARREAVLEAELTRALEETPVAGDVDEIAIQELAVLTDEFNITDLRTGVRRAVLRTLGATETDENPRLDTEALRETFGVVDGERVESVTAAQSISNVDISEVTFDDVGGLEEAKDRLYELLEVPIDRADAFAAFELPTNSGILLYGPPGNGKTLLAKAVANETGRTFVSVAGPELMNPFGAGTERLLRNVFEKARRNAPTVVFFDEFDAIGTKRGMFDGAKDDIVNTLLTELDGLHGNDDVVVIAATNRLQSLDSALLRAGRFEHLVEVAPPDAASLQAVFDIHTRAIPLAPDVTSSWFTDQVDDLTGADVAAICTRAAVSAIRGTERICPPEDIIVTRQDFREAFDAFGRSQAARRQTSDDAMFW
jgi:transitional endoplasmic reticulum ATPase